MASEEGVAGKGTILVVEDDEEIRTLLVDLLSGEGYTVVAVADGRTAIKVLREHFPPPEIFCLVLLDMMLPKTDGVEVLRAVTRLGRYVPVVAMSASPSHLQQASSVGANAGLSKPFDIEQILEIVRKICG